MLTTVSAIFNSYSYNREYRYMVDLCREVLERAQGSRSNNRTDDGDIIYGYLVLLYGDYGTSPRSGWIEDNYIEDITGSINALMDEYEFMSIEEENKDV